MDYIHANVVALDVNMALNKFIGRQQDSHVQELVEYRGIACVCSDEESHGHNGDGDDSFEDQKENNIADIKEFVKENYKGFKDLQDKGNKRRSGEGGTLEHRNQWHQYRWLR